MNSPLTIAATALLALAPHIHAADALLLTGATVHTVSGPTLTPGQVLIRAGRIEAVGPSLDQPGARVIELSGLHLYPGLIAPSTLLGLVEINAVRATLDTTEVGQFTPDVRSWIAVNPDSELIPVARANGITHILPVPLGGTVTGQSALVQLDGWTSEEMAIVQPLGLHVFWPSMSLDTRPRSTFQDKSRYKTLPDQARDRRARLDELDRFFQEARTHARSQSGPVAPAWDAMAPYVRAEKRVFIHADEIRQIRAALAWARTNNLQPVLVGARDAWMAADELSGIPVIYEHTFTLPPHDSAPHDIQFKTPALLHAKGVPISFSEGIARSGAANLRNLPYSAAQAVAHGLPPEEALKGLTLYSAQALGVADRLGSIEPGKNASLFAADGDILDIRTRVKRLWIAGREIDLATRHTRLYEKYRARPRLDPADAATR